MKKAISCFLALAILLSMSVSAFAADFENQVDDIPYTVTSAAVTDEMRGNQIINPTLCMPALDKDATNEYDYIVQIRAARKNNLTIANMSEEEIKYITSDAIESELAYRATLPTEVLNDQYCYSDEAIGILRTYEGERIEDNPELRAVTATLSTGIGELVKSGTRMGVVYSWSWDYKPLVLLTDYAAMSWEGTYAGGRNNNMAFDSNTSFSTVNYYYTNANQRQLNFDFESDNLYHGAAISFPAEKYINTLYYWAKYGSIFVYTDLVNQSSGPRIYEFNAHAEFAHYTVGLGAGVSFPAGISISFSGVKNILGVKNLRMRV